jgi:hypothetical protein
VSRTVTTALWLLTAAAVLSVALVAVRQPFGPGDYVAIWGLKARALERSGDVAALFRVDPSGASSHPEYPPLWPALLAAFSHLFVGRYDDLVVTPLWPALALAAALLAARATAAPPWGRVLAAAAVALLPYWRVDLGYAEGLLAVLLLAALGEVPHLAASRFAPFRLAFFLTLAAWTKQEGVVAAAVFATALAASGRRRDAGRIALSVGLLGVLPWFLVLGRLGPGLGRADFDPLGFSFAKLAAAGGALGREALPACLPWLAGAAILLALAPRTRRRRRGTLAAAVAYGALLVLSFGFTTRDPAWLVVWSWDRLAFVMAVVLVPVLAEAVAEPFAGPLAEPVTGVA